MPRERRRTGTRSLPVIDVTEPGVVPAGAFSPWLRRTRKALATGGDATVPCGACTACCRSSQFVHVGPDETDALSRIPKELLFPAPGLSKGHVLMGYDEQGCCPMLVDDRCSIYGHRPQTCRSYDCRVFPAAGIAVGDDDKALIAERTERWQFSYPTKRDRLEHAAVRAAAVFLKERAGSLGGKVPPSSTGLAVLAIKVCDVFQNRGDETGGAEEGGAGRKPADREVAEAVMRAGAKFDAGR